MSKLSIPHQIAAHIGAKESQVDSAIALLDDGATVPFISRYRKEATGGLTDTQLRQLNDKLIYLREFEQRRDAISKSIEEQGKLDSTLRARLNAATTKAELEDLYLPYKKKRRTKGQIAIEAGLEPLANLLWEDPQNVPEKLALDFLNTEQGFDDEKSVLEGARYVLMERFSENADLLAELREMMQTQGYFCADVLKGKETEGEKFKDYFDHQELYSKVPGHRALAMFRGRAEGVLALKLKFKQGDEFGDEPGVNTVAKHYGFHDKGLPADAWRSQVINFTWRVKLSTHLETELFMGLRARADEEAIQIFASNLRDLLLAAPAGSKVTLGLDPGYRTGVKVAVINTNGRVVDHTAIYPHAPQKQWDKSLETLASLCKKHKVELIAIGNGTASRETEKLGSDLVEKYKLTHIDRVVVSEAGASVYSASEIAEREHPDLDVTIRGAVSIARRLQDPLAELVKIDPKAIGVGQYQHDVSQFALGKSLDATVEDCVNSVGVDLQTASAALLSRVAGLSTTLAENIVTYRESAGSFSSRSQLKKVPRLGPKAFEQAAGFLRIRDGENPLDASGVHPEAYPVVKRIEKQTNRSVVDLLGDEASLRQLKPENFIDENFGIPTVKDILSELEKPGRDPRPEFRTVRFADGVDSMGDLVPGQVLEGQVTNVTAFGAFVDIGVHQDGLVHISALSHEFVKDPRSVVKTGDIVKVKVMQVDIARKRIGLSMRLDDSLEEDPGGARERRSTNKPGNKSSTNHRKKSSHHSSEKTKRQATADSPFAQSLKAALKEKGS